MEGLRTLAVVEDNADNRLLLEAILSERYTLRQYESGDAALAGIHEDRPDLVILDISLPEMSGEEVLAEIRGNPETASLPVVALTAHAMAGDREKFLDAGFDGYVSKPIVDEDALLGVIERLLL